MYLATTGETITALQHNSPLTDIAADLNAPRPVTAGGTGANTAAAARTNLSVYSKTEADTAIAAGFPSSAVDGNFPAFDGTGGDTLKDSGLSSASFATAAQGATADSATQATDLASTSSSKGASLVGIQDSGGKITATTVEGALAEVAGRLDDIGSEIADLSAGDVGAYMFAYINNNPGTAIAFGGTVSGTKLIPSAISGNGPPDTGGAAVGASTWACMGRVPANSERATLWQRKS